MTDAYRRLVNLALLLAATLPGVTVLCSRLQGGEGRPGEEPWTVAGQAVVILTWLGAAWLVREGLAWLWDRYRGTIDALAQAQARACDGLGARQVPLAIAAAAALSLLLELAVIRWQGAVFELFAFYKNLSLLACFLGLGLGYAIARQPAIPLLLTTPLLAAQMLMLLLTRHALSLDQRASLRGLPVLEQLNMGTRLARSALEFLAVYWFLAAVFLLTALAFVPVGQLCGRLMDRAPTLRAYGLNLLGSLVGVLAMFAVSALYLPPVAWFALGLGGLLVFQGFDRRALGLGIAGTLTVLVLLAWPVSFGWEPIYSPYQLLERGPGENGLSQIRSAGTYYQRIHNLSDAITSTTTDPGIKDTALYYEFPYRVKPDPIDVLVVGAGSGNDVAAALRRGAQRVDAVEIDPAIVEIGRLFHPEKPYSDRRVQMHVNDARTYLRTTDRKYDLIVYALLDSHTLLSHASNVRLDSFVYTVEGLREARARLKPGGVLSLSFSVISMELGRKIYLMLQQAFDGQGPRCVQARYNYDDSTVFLQAEGADLTLPTAYMRENGFRDVSAALANPAIPADVSTDDWPFFYMPQHVYPTSYLGMIALILALTVLLVRPLTGERPRLADAPFFLLGAGFLLLQTKAITELGLAFGNTWQVIGVVIVGMLLFAFLANLTVERLGWRDPRLPLLLVLATLALGWWVSRSGGLPPTDLGRLGTVALLTGPVFFSGIAFSSLAARRADLPRAMAANLLGALCGGLMEYNSMYFGFRFLYGLAFALYGLALLATLLPARHGTASTTPLEQPARRDAA